jgi:hypothetical protein
MIPINPLAYYVKDGEAYMYTMMNGGSFIPGDYLGTEGMTQGHDMDEEPLFGQYGHQWAKTPP